MSVVDFFDSINVLFLGFCVFCPDFCLTFMSLLARIRTVRKNYAGVAQLFRALPCQGRGRELESLHPHHLKKDAQAGDFLC